MSSIYLSKEFKVNRDELMKLLKMRLIQGLYFLQSVNTLCGIQIVKN